MFLYKILHVFNKKASSSFSLVFLPILGVYSAACSLTYKLDSSTILCSLLVLGMSIFPWNLCGSEIISCNTQKFLRGTFSQCFYHISCLFLSIWCKHLPIKVLPGCFPFHYIHLLTEFLPLLLLLFVLFFS